MPLPYWRLTPQQHLYQHLARCRAAHAWALRQRGLTYRAIGTELGRVSVERAQQLVRRGRRDANGGQPRQ